MPYRIKREFARYTKDGKTSKINHSEMFGKNNRFISGSGNKLILCTPFCEKISDCVNKISEITNVVLCKLYESKEVILPTGEAYLENDDETVEIGKITGVLSKVMESKEKLIKRALRQVEEGYEARFCLKTCPNIISESVALIKDAISVGVDYEILNKKKGIVEFTNEAGHKEFVIDGNETNRDSYIFPIITDDKFLVKRVMKENSINTPYGELLKKDSSDKEKNKVIKDFENKPVVVKPRNTNYGIGITVLSNGANETQLKEALEYAFRFDDDVIFEEYVSGQEYRFLVIEDKCVSVVYRRSASVVGDGKSTIKELIDAKNKESWHYLTETPVVMDELVVEFLNKQGYTYDGVIKSGERVYLRKNSNCSTGGESVDITNKVPTKFKEIAEKVAKCFDAKISGIDMIIPDLDKDDYGIIEINDTPGYTINEWPYEGEGRKVGLDILKLLNLI